MDSQCFSERKSCPSLSLNQELEVSSYWGRHFRSRDRLKTRPLASVGFPDSSAGKESACSAGDPGSIPGSRRPPGEGKGYPHQYSWAPLVAQLVKNPPAMQDTWVQSLGQEDPPEKGTATHSSIPAWRTPWTVLSMGWQSQTRLSNLHFHFHLHQLGKLWIQRKSAWRKLKRLLQWTHEW